MIAAVGNVKPHVPAAYRVDAHHTKSVNFLLVFIHFSKFKVG